MAHGFVSSKDARGDLNLGALVAGKVKNALAMSAEERKAREAEIKELEEKEELTAEETERLDFLKGQDKERKEGGIGKSFFAKAMMSEFGGDRRRRLMGTFSKSPDATKDPSLSKEQRFSALLNARPGESPVAPSDDIRPEEYGDAVYQKPTPQQGSLDKLIDIIKSQYSTIGAKISSLGAEEKKGTATQESSNSNLVRITGVLESIKSYFKKDNELKETENEIEKDKIEMELDAQQDAKASAKAAQMGQGDDLSGQIDTDTLEEQKARGGGDKGILGNLFDFGKNVVGNFFKGGGKGGGKTPGVTPSKQYTKPIGPQPMNSPTPWSPKAQGERGGMFGGGGFTPRMPSAPTPPTKLSEGGVVPPVKSQGKLASPKVKLNMGGIVDNPTNVNLPPGSGVIPLNRNNALSKMFKSAGQKSSGKKMAQPMAEVMQLPSKVGGGLLLSLLNRMMSKLGGIARFVKPVIKKIATPVASMFGLPATIVSGLLGGPAAAATMDGGNGDGGGSDTKGLIAKLTSMFGGRSTPSTTTPSGGAGADLAGTSVVSEVTGQQMLLKAGQSGAHADIGVTSTFGRRTSPGGVGSTNHQGVDIGVSGKKDYKVAFKRGGTVTHSGVAGGFGNLVIIKDSAGTEYYFAHLASINPEMKVGAAYTGQTIGVVGNTGTGTGEHLHFEKHPNAGAAVDPIADIGLISIGKQTTTSPGTTAPVIARNNNGTTPRSSASSLPTSAHSGPVIASAAATPPPKKPAPTTGLSTLPVKDPSWIDDPYLAWM